MIRRSFRVGLTLGVLAGLGFALAKMLGGRSEPATSAAPARTEPWPRLVPDPVAPSPTAPVVEEAVVPPVPVKPAAVKKKPLVAAWVEPSGDECPTSHPVKAKLSSKIFHLPGMLNYDRTKPDRCYKDAGAAEGDGLRASKR